MAPAPVRRGPAPQQKLPKQRYFKGKPGAEVRSDSDDDDEEDVILPTRSTAPKLDPNLVAGGAGKIMKMESSIKMDLSKAKIGDGGVKHGEFAIADSRLTPAIGEESEDGSEDEEEVKPSFVPKPPDDSSEYETDSEEESSEEEEPPKPAFRPMFVNK